MFAKSLTERLIGLLRYEITSMTTIKGNKKNTQANKLNKNLRFFPRIVHYTLPKKSWQKKTALIIPTRSANKPATNACLDFLIPTDPKYTART